MIPRTAREQFFPYVPPINTEHFSCVFVPVSNWKLLWMDLKFSIRRQLLMPAFRLTLSMISHSLIDPSPEEVTSWFSCSSDQATLNSPSCVSKLREGCLPSALLAITMLYTPPPTACLEHQAKAGPGRRCAVVHYPRVRSWQRMQLRAGQGRRASRRPHSRRSHQS